MKVVISPSNAHELSAATEHCTTYTAHQHDVNCPQVQKSDQNKAWPQNAPLELKKLKVTIIML